MLDTAERQNDVQRNKHWQGEVYWEGGGGGGGQGFGIRGHAARDWVAMAPPGA
jgi:hypothetical protein